MLRQTAMARISDVLARLACVHLVLCASASLWRWSVVADVARGRRARRIAMVVVMQLVAARGQTRAMHQSSPC